MSPRGPGLLLLLAGLSACGWTISQEELDTRLDSDGDGVVALAHGGEDCDDEDDSVFPGADELCDGLDNDCDDDTDEDAVDAVQFAPDSDGDGWAGPEQPVLACEAPSGTVPFNPSSPVDCDDGDDTVFPGADELCDGLDNDCDDDTDEGLTGTWYEDLDEDGWGDADTSEESCPPGGGWVQEAGDCDDEDGSIHPEAEEVCGDLVDQDCDEVDADCLVLGLDKVATGGVGASGGARFGQALSALGGHVAVGAPGDQGGAVASLHLEPLSAGLDASSADLQILGVAGSEAGTAIALSDDLLDAGALTLVVGAPEHDDAGLVALFPAVPGDPTALEDATALILPSTNSWTLGLVLHAVGDLTGDGRADLLVGDPGYGEEYQGAAWIVAGPVSGWTEIDEHDQLLGMETSSAAGRGLQAANDLDGDGFLDIVVGAPQTGTFHGQAFVVLGPVGGDLELKDADGIILVAESHSMLGAPIAGGDVDGDGVDDLLLGAIGLDRSSYTTGKVGLTFLFTGLGEALPTGVDSATGRLEQEADYDSTDPDDQGMALSARHDLDGDGRSEVVLSYPERAETGHGLGTTYLVYGGVEGLVSLGRAQVRFVGDGPDDEAGRAVAIDDLDGDGLVDLLIGAPAASPTAGRVFRVPGGSW